MALTDEELREAARHRGLKLLKSRRRKAGVGDYGKFGLADPAGKPLFGVGDKGLTATAEEVADYLRKGEVATWAESARVTPEGKGRMQTAAVDGPDTEAPPSAIRPRPRRRITPSSMSPRIDANPEPERELAPPTSRKQADRPVSKSAQAAREAARQSPDLAVRPARRADADAMTALLSAVGFAGDAPAVRKAIVSAAARKEPVLVADRGGVVGLLAWTIVPDIVVGAIGRISVVVVNKDDRRRGIGRALFGAVVADLGKHKVGRIEGMSDIEIRNANGFFRSIGLKQASYRFVSEI